MQKDLDELNTMAEQYRQNYQQIGEYYLTGGVGLSEHQARAIEGWLAQMELEYGFSGPEELKCMITQKTAFLSEAKRLQEVDGLNAVANPERQRRQGLPNWEKPGMCAPLQQSLPSRQREKTSAMQKSG